jgi:hypothetical protein
MQVATQPTRRDSLKNGLPIMVANQIEVRHKHAAKCKHTPTECALCQDTAEYVKKLAPSVSAVALENAAVRQRSGMFTLNKVIFEHAREKFEHHTKRGEADYVATAKLFGAHKRAFPNQYPKK